MISESVRNPPKRKYLKFAFAESGVCGIGETI